MFRDLFENRMSPRETVTVDTASPAQEDRERDASGIRKTVAGHLRPHLEEVRDRLEQPAGLDPDRTFGALGSRADLMRHVDSLLVRGSGQPSIGVPISSILPADVIISPPYAGGWQSGGGGGFNAGGDGKLITFSAPGLSVSAVGVYLTSRATVDVSAAIMPLGTFNWNWTTFEDLPTLQTRGGLGYSVSRAGKEIAQRDCVMWSQSGARAFTGAADEGELKAAVSAPSGPFGPISLFPATINMQPHEPYLFSLWCWEVAAYPENSAFIAFAWATMAALRLRFGPAIQLK